MKTLLSLACTAVSEFLAYTSAKESQGRHGMTREGMKWLADTLEVGGVPTQLERRGSGSLSEDLLSDPEICLVPLGGFSQS